MDEGIFAKSMNGDELLDRECAHGQGRFGWNDLSIEQSVNNQQILMHGQSKLEMLQC